MKRWQRITAELAADHAQEGTNVYDQGFSTGTTLIGPDQLVAGKIKFIGIDESQEMLSKALENVLMTYKLSETITLELFELFGVFIFKMTL